jgi:hypothetical protein
MLTRKSTYCLQRESSRKVPSIDWNIAEATRLTTIFKTLKPKDWMFMLVSLNYQSWWRKVMVDVICKLINNKLIWPIWVLVTSYQKNVLEPNMSFLLLRKSSNLRNQWSFRRGSTWAELNKKDKVWLPTPKNLLNF